MLQRIHDGGDTFGEEISDHQKPGISRAQKVSARPAMPLIRKSQPNRMVTARLAAGGTIMAANPKMTKRMPSIRNAFQCALTASRIFVGNSTLSWVIELSRTA